MPPPDYLIGAIVVLAAAVVGAALLQRLRLGPVLGYLAAGVIIGPAGLALVGDVAATRALAELGVVFLLFTVGLELPFERIRVMPRGILWLGLAQVFLTGAVIAALALAAGLAAGGAIAIGGALALSSTAMVLRLLADGGDLNSRFGRAAFGVLILQDLLVGPLLVFVFALGGGPTSVGLALGLAVLKAAALMAAILVVGRFLLRPLFAPVAAARTPEIFAALTLLVVLCAAFASRAAGLSMAFGALLAGMLLADSPYRHQVAAEIEPFRGMLLGLFFMTVGMSLDLDLVAGQWAAVGALAATLLLCKAALLAGLARLLVLPAGQALRFGLLLSQGGEFAFVLLAAGLAQGAVAPADHQRLVAVVIVSMMLTPALAALGRGLWRRIERRAAIASEERLKEEHAALADHAIVVGFGRIGRVVSRRLTAEGVAWVAIDSDPACVIEAGRAGLPVHFGDAWRVEVLETLGVERARAVVVTVNDPKAAVQMVAALHYVLPDLPILARAYDDAHAEELRRAGARVVVPEPTPVGDRLAEQTLALIDGERKAAGA